MWLITLNYATCVLELIPKVLARSLQEDSREDPQSWTHIISTLTRQLEWPTFNYFHINRTL
jgi:hypothetical protein